eukprot:scaffold24873_cov47-Prasinocladus_malaysianus.AAC.1
MAHSAIQLASGSTLELFWMPPTNEVDYCRHYALLESLLGGANAPRSARVWQHIICLHHHAQSQLCREGLDLFDGGLGGDGSLVGASQATGGHGEFEGLEHLVGVSHQLVPSACLEHVCGEASCKGVARARGVNNLNGSCWQERLGCTESHTNRRSA